MLPGCGECGPRAFCRKLEGLGLENVCSLRLRVPERTLNAAHRVLLIASPLQIQNQKHATVQHFVKSWHMALRWEHDFDHEMCAGLWRERGGAHDEKNSMRTKERGVTGATGPSSEPEKLSLKGPTRSPNSEPFRALSSPFELFRTLSVP